MGSKLFDGLKQSIQDAGKFMRGEEVPGLTLHTVSVLPVEPTKGSDLKVIREKYRLSQGTLAEILGVSRKTIEAWEHDGVSSKPASRILQIIEAKPEIMTFLLEEKQRKSAG